MICSEHLPGQSWGMWGMTSSSFLKAIKWSPCCNMLKSHENDNTSVNLTENGLCVRSGVQTVASSEQEAMQQSLKGFHLMSNTLPLWPDTRGCWGSTLPVWQNLKHKTWTLGKNHNIFPLGNKSETTNQLLATLWNEKSFSSHILLWIIGPHLISQTDGHPLYF